MAFTYTTQAAGWSLTTEFLGSNAVTPAYWVIEKSGGLPGQTVTWYYEDGSICQSVISGSQSSPWSVGLAGTGETTMLVSRIVVNDGATTYIDAVWDQANTGVNICEFTDCLAYYDPNNVDGHGTAIGEGDQVRYIRDLSGNENTMIATVAGNSPTWTALEIGEPSVWVDAAQSFQSKVFAHSQAWSAYATVKCETGGALQYVLNADDGVGARQAEYLTYTSLDYLRSVTYNTAVTGFTATTSTDAGPTVKHALSALRGASSLTLYIDGAEAATVATTGTPETTTSWMRLASTQAPGTGMWLGKVALFSEVLGPNFPSLVKVNLAPSPGGVLTATASPRTRIRIGMSVSPDGGPP